jgi:hypothetical protein
MAMTPSSDDIADVVQSLAACIRHRGDPDLRG